MSLVLGWFMLFFALITQVSAFVKGYKGIKPFETELIAVGYFIAAAICFN